MSQTRNRESSKLIARFARGGETENKSERHLCWEVCQWAQKSNESSSLPRKPALYTSMLPLKLWFQTAWNVTKLIKGQGRFGSLSVQSHLQY